jgi:hypothetical protein
MSVSVCVCIYKMGFELWITYKVMFDRNGRPTTNLPTIPRKYGLDTSVHGYFYANFVSHFQGGISTTASQLLEHLPAWEDIDWEHMNDTQETYQHFQEDYEDWRNAMKWFAENDFWVEWSF